MWLEFYQLDPVKFLPAPKLAWKAALKKTEVKLELLTNSDMLLKIEKRITKGIYHSTNSGNVFFNKKYMKDYDKDNKESSFIKYWYINNEYGWEMSQKLQVNCHEWVEDTSNL